MRPAQFDIAVVGGGPAGIAAATSAAHSGARTLLVERSSQLGGNVADANVHTICGLFEPADSGPRRYANPGLPRRVARALAREGSAGEVERAGRVWVLPIDPPAFAQLARRLCGACDGLRVETGTALVGVQLGRRAGERHELALCDARGEHRVLAAILVDTSGDAAAAALGGADFELAEPGQLQASSFIFRVAGVAPEATAGFARLRVTLAAAGAARRGELPRDSESILVRPAGVEGEAYLTLNVPRPAAGRYDPLDGDQLRDLHAGARRAAGELVAFLRAHQPGFDRCRVLDWPVRLGVRETRRIRGRECLERDDVLRARAHPDEVARSSWPIELWGDHRRASFEHPQGSCSIPLGALVSRSSPTLGMAGRCLSASHAAHGALRVIGTALATGEAIGVAAAQAVRAGVGLDQLEAAAVRRAIAQTAEAACRAR